MRKKTEIWLKGIAAGLITGVANGMLSYIPATTLAPGVFNLETGMRDTLMMLAWQVLQGAILGVAAYLKQSPFPPPDTQDIIPPPVPHD